MSYSELLIWQYQGKPKAVQTIKLFDDVLSKSFVDLKSLQDTLNIDTAEGVNLDLVGKHVGQSRAINGYQLRKFFGFVGSKHALSFSKNNEGGGEWYRRRDPLSDSVRLSDADYRFLIKCRILKNYQTGTVSNILESCRFIFGDNCSVIDNYDMTVSISLPSQNLNSFKRFAIQNLDILPRPMGVRFIYELKE